MKKILLIVFSGFLSFLASAQKIHFTDTSNVWHVLDTYDGGSVHHIFSYNGDTVINSNAYKIMLCPGQWASYPLCYSGTDCHSFIREDTILNKVFVLTNDTEQVLMDYNLNIGDSILYKNINHQIYIDKVSGIDSTIINSVYHKVWYFTNLIYPPGGPKPMYSVIEGVGCLDGPLFMPYPNWGLNDFFLTCFYHSSTNPLVSPSVLDESNSIYFNNHTSCTVGINAASKTISGYTLSPNPATTSLTITATNKITNITITNLLGQTVYTHECNTEKVEISVTDLPTGVYFVKINGTEVRKFVKE